MPRWLKITLLSLTAVLLLAIGGGYVALKSTGMIPKRVYETVPPEMPAFTRPAVLVFNKTNGFRHKEAIPVADQVFSELAAEQGWDVFVTDNGAAHNPEVLKRFQLVIWNNVSGDVLTESQRQSLKQWLKAGGGWVGVHGSGGDRAYDWHWYVDTLLGAQFVGHTMSPQFQDADVLVADPGLSLTGHLPSPWRVPSEEWYAFASNPRDKNYEILLTLDKESYTPGDGMFFMPGWTESMPGEHPLAWRHQLGCGRVFYSSIGHRPETYRLPAYRQLLGKAMQWAMAGTSETMDAEENQRVGCATARNTM